MLLIQPHIRNSQIVLPHIEPVHLIVELGSERMSYKRVFRHDNSPSAQPCSASYALSKPLPQRNLHVLTSPRLQLRVRLALVPPEFARGEHAHRDGREIVRFRPAAPELAKIRGERSGAADAIPDPFRDELVGIQAEINEVY